MTNKELGGVLPGAMAIVLVLVVVLVLEKRFFPTTWQDLGISTAGENSL